MTSFLSKLKSALSKTSNKIGSGLEHIFIKRRLDTEVLQELEDVLLMADVGTTVTNEIIEYIKKHKFNKEVTTEEIKQDLADIIEAILAKQNHKFDISDNKLNIIVVCGVNGNGKTTSIGKLASNDIKNGKKVAIAACDTYRAAAVGQIEEWAQRAGARLYKGEKNADPASVTHQAIIDSIATGIDVLYIDTAGRLHNQKNLMEELAKIVRVIKKIDATAPHHCLLVIDGTTGQNASIQVEQFKSITNVSGLIITKLDGTAKAGSVVGIVKKFSIPVHYIGIGEAIGDLKPFDVKEFSRALVGL